MLNLRGVRLHGPKSLVAACTLALALVAASCVATVTPAAAQTHTQPDLAVELATRNALVGSHTYYDIRVKNLGTAPSGNYSVVSLLPRAFRNVRVNAPGYSCTVQTGDTSDYVIGCDKLWLTGPLGPGQTSTLRVYANAPTRDGNYPVLARVDSAVPESETGNNSVRRVIRVFGVFG